MTMSLTEDETNFLRLSILIIKVAPQAVRVLFDNRIPPTNLSTVLLNNMTKLTELNNNRIINTAQWDLLFPTTFGVVTSSSMYDVTLLICLLRNIASPTIRRPVSGFDKLPLATDVSEGADMARIKHFRNFIAHNKDGSIQSTYFNKAWTDLCGAISRLGGGKYNQDCSNLRVASLDGSDKEVYREVLLTQQTIRDLKSEIEELRKQTVPNNIHEMINRKLQIWEEKDIKFVDTESSKALMTQIKDEDCVLVTGNSGSGKSATCHHVTLSLMSEGYSIIPIIKPKDIIDYHSPLLQQVFICDDFCGKYYADVGLIQEWLTYEEDLKMIFENSNVKLILNCRLIVSQDEHFKLLTFLNFSTINLSCPGYRLTLAERKSILKKHTTTDEDEDDTEVSISNEIMESQDCFPLLCQLFGESEQFRSEPEKFFSQPFEEYKKDIEKLKVMDRFKYCSLALLVVFWDSIEESCLTESDITADIQDKIQDVCLHVGLPQGTSRKKLHEELVSLENIYVKRSEDKFSSLHDKMFDFVSCTLGPCLGECILKHSTITFIRERVRLFTALTSDDENVIVLNESLQKSYFRRMFKEILSGNLKDVFLNRQMKDESFQLAMIKELKTLDDTFLIDLITMNDSVIKFKCKNNLHNDLYSVLETLTNSKLDEISKFQMNYLVYLLSDNYASMFHWIIARGMYLVYRYVKSRLPLYVEAELRSNILLCICLSVIEDSPEMLKELIPNGRHHSQFYIGDDDKEKYYPLFLYVCLSGHINCVQTLWEEDITYPRRTETGESALWLASYAGHLQVVKFLLTKIPHTVNLTNDNGVTPLFIAAQKGHKDILNILIENSANVNICRKDGASSLFIACQEGYTEVVEILSENNADVNKQKFTSNNEVVKSSNTALTPLYIACKMGHLDICKLLLNFNADIELSPPDGKSPLIIALQNGHIEIVRLLVQCNANVNVTTNKGITPLTIASGVGQEDSVSLLIKKGANVNIDQPIGNLTDVTKKTTFWPPSPITMAALNNHTHIVDILLGNGANIDYQGVEGATALFEASQRGHEDVVNLLLRKKASVNITTVKGRTPLYVALDRRFLTIARTLLQNGGDPNICRDDGVSPLLKAVAHGHYNLVELLLAYKANPNLVTLTGLSPLMSAATLEDNEILQLLLRSGADVNLKNNCKQTALWLAANGGRKGSVHYLLDYGASVNTVDVNRESVLLAACKNNDETLIKLCITSGTDVNLCNTSGVSPLYRACEMGFENLVRCLLENGAEANMVTNNNTSSLMAAASNGNSTIAEMLLKHNVDIDTRDNNGETALWKAVVKGDFRIVQMLIKRGANLNLRVGSRTLLTVGQESGHDDIIALLQEKQGYLRGLFRTISWIIPLLRDQLQY